MWFGVYLLVFSLLVFVKTAVEEYILLPGVPMQVQKHQNLLFFTDFSDLLPKQVHLRMHPRATDLPLAVQVETRPRKSIIAIDDPVRVDHRHYHKHKAIFDVLTVLAIACQLLQETLHHQRADGLTWVHAGGNYDHVSTGPVSGEDQRDLSSLVGFS